MTPPVPVRLSVVALDLATAFSEADLPPGVPPLLAKLDQSGVVIHGFRIVESAEGRIVQLRFPPGAASEARIEVPGLTMLELVASLGGDAILEVLEPGPHTRYAEVRGLRLAVRFDPALLRPVDGAPRAELAWTGGLRWHPDWRIELVGDPELSLSPCEIAGTGIVVELAGLQLDFSTDRSPAAILNLGLGPEFQGMYARAGSLSLLPQVRFGGQGGLRVEVHDFAVGTGGVTGYVGQYFPLERTAEGALDPATGLIGSLFDDAWQLGIGTVEVALRANAVEWFMVAGLARVPLIDPLLDLRFGMQRSDTGYATTLYLGTASPISVPVAGGRLRVGSFALEGVFGGSDSIAVSGSVTDVEVDLAPLSIKAEEVSAALEHRADGDELRFALREVPIGPLGTLDTAELVLTSTASGRKIRFEAAMAWDDLRPRINLPADAPAPAGGIASVAVNWEENGHVIVRFSAAVGDLSSLLTVVPEAYRPQIEQAALDITIDYPSAADFAATPENAPFTGSASFDVTVRFPMLLAIPGVFAVRAGDNDGRVHAHLSLAVDGGGPRLGFAVTDPVELDLTLPGLQTGAPVVTLALDSVALAQGDRPERSTFSLAGAVSTPALDAYLPSVAEGLGLPAAMNALLQPLGGAFAGDSTFALSVAFDGATTTPSMAIVSRPASPPVFALLKALGALVDPGGTPATAATTLPGLGVPDDFFAVAPGELRFSATLSDTPSIRLSGSLNTTVFGETFDMTAAVEIDEGDFTVDVAAGAVDPILITLPAPDPTALLGTADLAAVSTTYGLDQAAHAQLTEIQQFLTGLAGELSSQGVLAYEIRDLSIGVTPAGPTARGGVRLVQLPRFLEQLTPLSQLVVRIGAEVDKIFLTVDREGGDSSAPLLTVPVPGDNEVDVNFRGFLLAYAWGRNEVAFGLDASIVPRKPLHPGVGGTGVLVPAVDADIQLGATVTAPPAPMPEGILSFRAPQRGADDTAADELGLQAVIGVEDRRLVTAYLRHLEFSPIYFLLWPGFGGDGGLVLGGPNPKDLPTAEDYFNVREWDRGEFFARFTVQNGSLIFFDAFLGVMLNPLAIVPPFVTANPPYWMVPGFIMGDLYADEIGVSVNLPGLAFLDLTFERPLPRAFFSLQGLLELAALAAGGFTTPIPATSPLRKMFYARARAHLELQPLGLGGAGAAVSTTAEVNVADLINGAIGLMNKASETLDSGVDLVAEVSRDPAALVRMLPRTAREAAYNIELAGFTFSGSLYLLTPEELRDELMLFFENKRRRPRGIAANQPAPAATGAGLNLAAVLDDVVTLHGRGILDLRTLQPDMKGIGARPVAAAVAGQHARDGKLAQLREDRRKNVNEAADFVARSLAALPPGDPVARKALLLRIGMDELVAPIEAALRGLRLDPAGLEQRAHAAALEVLSARNDAMVADSGLSAPPEQVAARLVARVVPSPAGRTAPVVILPQSERLQAIDELIPARRTGRAREVVRTVFDDLERELTSSPPGTPERERAVAAATKHVAAVLTEQFGVRRGKLDALLGAGIDVSTVSDAVGSEALATWAVPPRVTDRLRDVKVFDGGRLAGLLSELGVIPPDASVPDTVVEQHGYQIQTRDGGVAVVEVPTATALFKVVLDGMSYRLHLRQKDRSWTPHDLPNSLVARIPEGPSKAEQLRDELIVAPRTTRRPRTPEESAAVADSFEASDNLYQTSVLARPEYQVKPEGGVHGPFYLADLLRAPGSGNYTVPSGPTLLGGFAAEIFGSKVRFGGILTGGAPETSAFLYGHHYLDVPVGPFRLKAKGDFVASIGALWQTIPAPSGALQAANVVGFSGHVTVQRGSTTLFEGSAEGEFTAAGGKAAAHLNVHVTAEGHADFGLDDETAFVRVGWALDGTLDVSFDSRAGRQPLTVEAHATAEVTVERATIETTWVVVEPEHTVCIPWFYIDSPVSGHWGEICTTTPEIKVPHIEFKEPPEWEPVARLACALRASVENGVAFSLDLEGSEVTGLLGTTSLPLPHLH